jgi:hypothetical protein
MRKALVIGGVIVLGVVVALLVALRKDTSEASQVSTGAGAPIAVSPEAPPVGHATVTEGTTGPAPTLPEPAAGEHPREYAVGDVRVRDHRSGDHAPLDIPPNPHPAEGRQLPSILTHEIAQQVRDVMVQCVATLPRDARGQKPRLDGQISVAITANKLTVTKSTMQLRDVTGESVEPTKQCIEQKAIGLENPAPDQADLDNYSINISFAIP